MVDPVTTNRGYAVPTRGSDVGTWDVPINGNFGLLDNNLGGVTNVAVSNANVTLTQSQYQCGTILLTGVVTSGIFIIFPAVQGWWTVVNNATFSSLANYVGAAVAGGTQNIGLPPGEAVDIYVNGTTVGYRNLGRVGSYLDDCSATVPSWISTASTIPPYLNCDGTTFSSTTYPILAQKLGTTTLPDLRGVSRATLNQGTSRITAGGSGIDGNTRFSFGGADTVQLQTSQIPSHSHPNSLTDPGHAHGFLGTASINYQIAGNTATIFGPSPANTAVQANQTGISINNGLAGGNGYHLNMGPTVISGITLIRAA